MPPPPPPPDPVLDAAYAKVPLPFLNDDSCPFCKMMKASPCLPHFTKFHQCATYHQQKQIETQKEQGEVDIATPCGWYAVRLSECIQTHKEMFPPEVVQQTERWNEKKKEGEGAAGK